jgi:hypothetical protein
MRRNVLLRRTIIGNCSVIMDIQRNQKGLTIFHFRVNTPAWDKVGRQGDRTGQERRRPIAVCSR